MKNLYQLNIGERAKIKSLADNSDYLMEIGFTPGQEIEILAKSPFGGPISISMRGTSIALRQSEARLISC
jgi:Fe2+ transport system protein FeoA